MSSFDRRLLLLSALAGMAGALSGCFRPMLAETAAAHSLQGKIALPPVDNRFGRALYTGLESRLGTPEAPRWRLSVETRVVEDDLAITQDDTITRKSLTARADYRLQPVANDRTVLKGSVVSQSGYNSTASLYATRAVRRDTEERLARDLGERIARRILSAADRLEDA